MEFQAKEDGQRCCDAVVCCPRYRSVSRNIIGICCVVRGCLRCSLVNGCTKVLTTGPFTIAACSKGVWCAPLRAASCAQRLSRVPGFSASRAPRPHDGHHLIPPLLYTVDRYRIGGSVSVLLAWWHIYWGACWLQTVVRCVCWRSSVLVVARERGCR